MSLPRLYPKKARSARLLGCKRPRNGLQSLPPFWEPCFLQTPRLRFPAKGGKALMRRCRSSSAQRHGCTNCKKRSLCSVFCKTFAYHLCAVKRLTALFCFGCTANFFRLCVPLFARNAGAQSFCLRGTESFGLHFARKTNIFSFFRIFKGIFLIFVEIIIYKCFYIIFFDYGGAHG